MTTMRRLRAAGVTEMPGLAAKAATSAKARYDMVVVTMASGRSAATASAEISL